jgi:hypothetical protein
MGQVVFTAEMITPYSFCQKNLKEIDLLEDQGIDEGKISNYLK